MHITPVDPPREFRVGGEPSITIRDCGRILLEADEQVTFVTPEGSEYDVARKAWGYYATPSTNGRLRDHGLRTALVVNRQRRLYVMLVLRGRESDFQAYLDRDGQSVAAWLDDDEAVEQLTSNLSKGETHVGTDV